MGRGGNEKTPLELAEFTQRKQQLEKEAVKEVEESTKKANVKYPDYLGTTFASILVFIMGASMRADWILFLAYYWKSVEDPSEANTPTPKTVDTSDLPWNEAFMKLLAVRLDGLFPYYIVPAFVVSYFFFFGIGGFLHYYYYVRQRAHPEDWKCQPKHWLSAELERHEIVVGLFSLTLGSFISACMACYVMNDGYSTIYYRAEEYGYAWLLLQVPITFALQDYTTYWFHRVYHMPFLYKHFHKLHHTYKQPTAFSVTAIHPFEFVSIQCVYIAPMFLFPVHYVPYSMILLYTYYHGIIDHSGINFKRYWWQPWQPNAIFHDNHHQYFHVNFGFNIELWDKIHGTYRQKDRLYTEDTFWGTGKALTEASTDEIARDQEERSSENPLAYNSNRMEFALSDSELKATMGKKKE